MKNGRCRMHGGKSLSGAAHGRFRHGRYTRTAIAQRRQLAAFIAECRSSVSSMTLRQPTGGFDE
jgi:hypothetical protein